MKNKILKESRIRRRRKKKGRKKKRRGNKTRKGGIELNLRV